MIYSNIIIDFSEIVKIIYLTHPLAAATLSACLANPKPVLSDVIPFVIVAERWDRNLQRRKLITANFYIKPGYLKLLKK